IYDYHSAGSAARGIQLEGVTDAWTISGNRFYQSAERSNTGGSHWAIDVGTTAAGAGGHTIVGNHIGGSAADGTGVYALTGNASFRGIRVATPTSGTLLATAVDSNTIAGISHTGYTTASYGVNGAQFSLIQVESGQVDVTDNTIGSQTADASVDPSIRFESSYTSNSYCEAFGIVNYSMQPVSITGNVLGGLNIQPGGSNSSGYWRAFSAIADYPSSNSSTTATTI